ncbi:MAG: iron chaperone [Chloroflexota bacterium]
MTKASNHDDYIAAAPEDLRPLLENLRGQLSRTLADAEEVIAYNMPGFRIGKTIVAGFAAFTKQCGVYVSPGSISSLAGDIAEAGLKATKTGVTFSPSNPIPDELIEKLALASRNDLGL